MGFIRARGFAEESGHFSFFLETLAPISIYYVFTQSRIKNIYKFFYCTIIVLSLIVTFSSFSYVSLLVAVLIAVYYYLTSFAKRQNTVVKILAVGGCIMLFSLLFSDVSALIIDVINTKTIGTENYEGRMNNAFTTISYLSENILWGYGPASYYRFDNSYFSLFFTILLDSGITGFACIALFLMKQFSIILKIKNKPFQCCCLISFVTATAHYIYIGNYYYPWYWFFLSMMYIFYLREKKHCEIFNYYRYQEQ
jgi:hypothetical protein